MGNTKSDSKKQQINHALWLNGQKSKEKIIYHIKELLILHKSNAGQLKVARNFRNALTMKAKGSVVVMDFINIANGNSIPHSLASLEKLNNVILICLTSESVEQFKSLILEKGFADQNGHLHDKVFTVSFGNKLDLEWPPKGLKQVSTDLRDFHFGFSDVENIRGQDFERSLRMDSLLASIRLTD